MKLKTPLTQKSKKVHVQIHKVGSNKAELNTLANNLSHAIEYDAVIIGGGAAGLMCAAVAGQLGKKVLLIDHANKFGKKILMSGGGRCNFTNLNVQPKHFTSQNDHFCISALKRFSSADFIELVERHGLEYHDKGQGQLFCDHKAKDIVNILMTECSYGQVKMLSETAIEKLHVFEHNTQSDTREEAQIPRYKLETTAGIYAAQSLVIATGGLSIPTMGATGFGYDLAQEFKLKIVPKYASLVPYTLKNDWLALAQSLAGVSLNIRVSTPHPTAAVKQQKSFTDALLFTHKGLSGPAILQITNYWRPNQNIVIDFLPADSIEKLLQNAVQQKDKIELKTFLSRLIPKRFVTSWLASSQQVHQLASLPVYQLTPSQIDSIHQLFHCWSFCPAGTEGFKTAEVTLGGVSTDEVSSKTFESKKVPGLFFIGEVLDVTGWLGGYNFQWAWASAYCAAQYI